MKLIDIIYKVILEEVRDEESDDVDMPSDGDREPEDREPEDREPEDREPEDREPEDREPEDRPSIGNWVCKDPVNYPGCQMIRTDSDARLITSYGFPVYRSQNECIEASPCRGTREPRPRTRPTTPVRPTRVQTTTEPSIPQGTETPITDVPKINMNTKYEGDGEIKDVKKIQSNKFIKIVQDKLVKQLELQPPQVKQKLKQFNIQPKNMSYLVPLSNATGILMLKMELDGLNLPLMMVLYKNTEGLYKSMTNNKQFTQKQANPISGAIDYKNFWKWNDEIYKGWGPWLKVNVAKNFPEISRNTFPSLSF